MIHFSKLIRNGHGLAPVLLKRATSITLDWDVRQKSRFESTDSAGRQVGVFLQRGQVVRGGDVLVGEDGSLLKVQAAPQAGGFSAGGRGLRLEPFVWQASRFQPAVRQRELADSDDLQSESACRGI